MAAAAGEDGGGEGVEYGMTELRGRFKPAEPEFASDQSQAERVARQKRLREAITVRPESFTGARVVIPNEISEVVGDKLTPAALIVLWINPSPFLWRDRNDPEQGNIMATSPMSMWSDPVYHTMIVDYFKVIVDDLDESPKKPKRRLRIKSRA